MKVIWSPEARQDLHHIYLYLAAENPYAARTLQERIKHGVRLLRDSPHIGRPGRVPGTRELVVSGTSYIVPYQLREKHLELLRVYHMARKWTEPEVSPQGSLWIPDWYSGLSLGLGRQRSQDSVGS